MNRHGILRAFDAGTYVATVQLVGSHSNYVQVSVSRAIASGEMVNGRKVAVLYFDDAGDPTSAVLTAVWT
jgi:hypothetical protein